MSIYFKASELKKSQVKNDESWLRYKVKCDNRKKNFFVKVNHKMEVKNLKRNTKTRNRGWTKDELELFALALTAEEKSTY